MRAKRVLASAIIVAFLSPGISFAQDESVVPEQQPAETSGSAGFAYGAIFWAPLVILVVGGYLAYGLTRKVPSRRG